MTTHAKLVKALRGVLYPQAGDPGLVERFVAKVDELQQGNLGIAFAHHCVARIDAFPPPLRSAVFLALPDTSLPTNHVVSIASCALDGKMWRSAMSLMEKMKVPRDEWFQPVDSLPAEFRERVLADRQQRLALRDRGETPVPTRRRRRRREKS